MIRVKIEMYPLGDERPESVREIGRMYIANVGGNALRGDYEVAVCRRGTSAVPAPVHPGGPRATRAGSVHNYPRLSYNVWRLISRAILTAFPEERATAKRPTEHDDASAGAEPTDEQALELGTEILEIAPTVYCGMVDRVAIGREAWRRGARPRGF